jgi:uncharacterized protein (DUF4415 family)
MSSSSDPLFDRFNTMDFSNAQPVHAIPALAKLQSGRGSKSRVTVRLDTDVLAIFKARAEMTGGNYQTLINQALRDAAQGMTLSEVVRKTIRQELSAG